MGWYDSFNKATKGLKKISKDLGRILAGKETSDVLDNAEKAAEVVSKLEGGGKEEKSKKKKG